MEVAVDAVLNLDMHERSNNFINVTNPPLKYRGRPPNVPPSMTKGIIGENTKGTRGLSWPLLVDFGWGRIWMVLLKYSKTCLN